MPDGHLTPHTDILRKVVCSGHMSPMSPTPPPDLLRAGQIAAHVRDAVERRVRPGVKVIDICTFVEKEIVHLGARPAFPCNVSINSIAAHYTSPHNDEQTVPETGLVKVDLGANVNGYLSDTAVTIDLDDSHRQFVDAVNSALQDAIREVRPGVRLGHVGAVIERTIRTRGLRPVHQLTGHQMTRWTLHAGKTVPNVRTRTTGKMHAGEVYAIEPFATDGSGTIRAATASYIFSTTMPFKKQLDPLSEEVYERTQGQYRSLPWASRWLYEGGAKRDYDAALRRLIRAGAIRGYPVLLEGRGRLVSQAEHTIIVDTDGAIVTTLGGT